jgi:LysR family transcriptional regulator, transcriptional activator of nhaA
MPGWRDDAPGSNVRERADLHVDTNEALKFHVVYYDMSHTTDWLNYHHLFYFSVIVQEGGLARAAARLRLSHSTLSTQLRALEQFFGSELFERRGRRLVLTPLGSEVAEYAAEIFRMGSELVDVARGHVGIRRAPLRVGVVHALPKTVTYRLLDPALRVGNSGPIHVRQGDLEPLVERIAANKLHLVLADMPPPQGLPVRVHGHLLGESEVLLYGTPRLAARYRSGFPESLNDAPLLLPGAAAGLRRSLERWLTDRGIRPRIEGEIDDSGLLRVFGGAGLGLFPVRAALRTEVEEAHGAILVGKLEGLRERYYAVSSERRVRHPGVLALIERARSRLAVPSRDASSTKTRTPGRSEQKP